MYESKGNETSNIEREDVRKSVRKRKHMQLQTHHISSNSELGILESPTDQYFFSRPDCLLLLFATQMYLFIYRTLSNMKPKVRWEQISVYSYASNSMRPYTAT